MKKKVQYSFNNLNTISRIVIFGIAALLVLILFFVILDITRDNNFVSSNDEKYIQLNELYEENALTFVNKKVQVNNNDCEYIQLSGLKQAKAENNINKDILNKVKELSKKENKSIYVSKKGNFSNILSVVFYIEEQNLTQIIDTLNYSLVTGDKLTIKDLFLSTADITSIINKEISKQINDNSINVEDIINNKYKFYFDQSAVYLLLDDNILEINFYDYYESFGLYNKYLTNISIFKNDNVEGNDLLAASYRDNGIYSKLDVEDNIFIDSVIYGDNNIDKKVLIGVSDALENIYDGLKTTKEYKFLNQSGKLTKLTDIYIDKNSGLEIIKNRYNIYSLNISSNTYNVSKEYFENKMVEDVYNLHRKLKTQQNNLVSLNKYNDLKKESFNLIILSNGKTLDKVTDLFIEGYDYKLEIKNIIMQKYNITEEELDNLLKDAKYDYTLKLDNLNESYSIVVTLNNKRKIYISFDEFDKNIINIY